jgi:hypothetical protein
MALKIKEGSELWAYGPKSNPFTSESELSQEILEHLQTRFPDDVVEDNKEDKNKSKSKNQ